MRAVENAYREHAPALYRYLLLQCSDHELAEDILQDTFIRLAERPPPRADHLRAWLFRVALNRLRDVLRVSRRRDAIIAQTGQMTLSDGPPAPERSIERQDAMRELYRILHELSPRDRQLLILREAGLTQREIAKVLGTTTGSVGTLLARALLRVARIMSRNTQTADESDTA